MSKAYFITIILGSIVVYFRLVAFCLNQSLNPGVADDPALKEESKNGAFMGNGWSVPVDVERPDRLNQLTNF